MYKIIGEHNRVNYGSIDEPVEFNYQDFKLLDLFDREITGIRKKFALHVFNYIGVITKDHLIGMAAVDLGLVANVFAFIFSYERGKLYEFTTIMPSSKLAFPVNPDEYAIRFMGRKGHLSIMKSHAKGFLEVDCNFENMLAVRGSFPYSLKTHRPLRVLNPSCGDPHLFTFTEKCSPIAPRSLDITFRGQPLHAAPGTAMLLYDWSGGYLNRNTNWLWAAFAGVRRDGTTIGANLAALVNETYYSENAFWVNNRRTRVQRVIFDFDMTNPTREWSIWSEDGAVEMTVKPADARSEKSNFGLIKVNFRQFVGDFSGRFKPERGRPVDFKNMKGLTEIHFSVW